MSKQSENSKQWIAEALFQLMETTPFSEITNKQITGKAGLSHITIYRNFDSKEEIVEYYLLECLERASLDNAKMDDLFRFYETNKKTDFPFVPKPSSICVAGRDFKETSTR